MDTNRGAAPSMKPGVDEGVAVVAAAPEKNKTYKGFVAGVFSGIAKLSGTPLKLFQTSYALDFIIKANQ